MTNSAALDRAANNVIVRSLGLRPNQHLLIFADANSLPVADAVVLEAQRLGVSAAVVYVPLDVQATVAPEEETLPLPIESAIREADAVLSCLSDRPEHQSYRLRVLRSSWNRRTKLAHAPGMDLSALRMADTDYGLIGERCMQLAQALILGRKMEITTEDSRGQRYRLRVTVDGRNYPPGITDGVIADGAWANLPPGETYIVPRDGEGEIAINGSIPGRVLIGAEKLILTFQAGRLVDMQRQDSHAARHLWQTQVAYAEERGDPNWSNLAEVGFGVNPVIKRLVGKELVDEKKSHTAHIALGHSASLGGDVDSVVHCDLVVRDPTVTLDGKPILDRGQWRVNASDWRLDLSTVEPPGEWMGSLTKVQRSGLRATSDNGRLLRTWSDGRGRWNSTPVGAETTARIAARLWNLLPEGGNAIALSELVQGVAAELSYEQVLRLLWIMRRYDLVRLPGEFED